MPLIPLLENEVHLWLCRTSEVVDPVLLSRYKALLDQQESSRLRRFRFEKHKHSFLVSHVLVRTVLSKYAALAADEWRFQTDEYGKPEIVGKQNDLNLRFNLSHTEGIAICAINRRNLIGADIEIRKAREKTIDIAHRYFSKKETADLKALEPAQQAEHFFDYWTLKESYIKAVGKGLSIPLDSFSFSFKPAGKITLHIEQAEQHEARLWCFWQLEVAPEHTAAICKEIQTTGPSPSLLVKNIVPLQSESIGQYTVKRSSQA